MYIAVIDRGIDFHHPKLSNCVFDTVGISSTCEITSNAVQIDDTGHGTAIAGIIHKMIPAAAICSVKLFATADAISEEQLAVAIEWCAGEEKLDIISVSLGIATRSPSKRLHDACELAYRTGKIIVAAVHNFPYLDCYPANFERVIGVGIGIVPKKTDYGYVGTGGTNVLAKGTLQRVIWKDNTYRMTSGTSYATPHFVAILAGMLLCDPQLKDRDKLMARLQTEASPEVQELNYINRNPAYSLNRNDDNREEEGKILFTGIKQYEGIDQLAVFPCCEKEMRTLLEHRNALFCSVSLLIDYPRLYSYEQVDEIAAAAIRRALLPEDLDKFDSLVLGYFLDQPFDAHILFGFNLILDCIRADKNFIVWDYNVYNYIKDKIKVYPAYRGRIIFHYADDAKYLKVMNYRHLPDVSVPVLAIAGTGSRQGKITTQLKINKILAAAGHRSGLLSTEPQGGLLGADFCFPYGHNSTVYLDLNRWDEFLQYTLKGIQYYNKPDIIITGTQGGIIPQRPGVRVNYDASILRSLQFLIGVQPDAIVLTVNISDSIEFIKKAIATIAVFCSAKLLFVAMSPWALTNTPPVYRERADAEKYKDALITMQNTLGIPVIDIYDSKNETLILESIENAFAYES